jgi:hypothetical protein
MKVPVQQKYPYSKSTRTVKVPYSKRTRTAKVPVQQKYPVQ